MTGVVLGGILKVFAFAGAGLIFSKFNHTGYEADMKRHNKALEDLAKAKEKWYENEVEQKNKIDRLSMKLSDANAVINDGNKALEELRRVTTIHYKGTQLTREPRLGDLYHPSDEMKEYISTLLWR